MLPPYNRALALTEVNPFQSNDKRVKQKEPEIPPFWEQSGIILDFKPCGSKQEKNTVIELGVLTKIEIFFRFETYKNIKFVQTQIFQCLK